MSAVVFAWKCVSCEGLWEIKPHGDLFTSDQAYKLGRLMDDRTVWICSHCDVKRADDSERTERP